MELPDLLREHNERHAAAMLEQIEIMAFPHITDQKAREAIVRRYQGMLPQEPPEPPKSAEEQYQALMARKKAGG